MRRPLWLGAGVALGVGGTLWAERRVRRTVRRATDRLTPQYATTRARARAAELGDRVRGALAEGRSARDRREAELWGDLDPPGGQRAHR